MKTLPFSLIWLALGTCLITVLCGQDRPAESSPVSDPKRNRAEGNDVAKPNANHALLAELVGTWDYRLNIRMGKESWIETRGVVVRQPIMGGRYFLADFNVEMLPGPGGKLEKVHFVGKSIEGYDNVKQKFVSIWIDNASTGMTIFEGTYDPNSRTFTYNAETESQPGLFTKVREIIAVADRDHYSLAWYEEHGGQEIKTVEINYTRRS